MGTEFIDIYAKFRPQITDYDISDMIEDVQNALFLTYLLPSISHFNECETDLTNDGEEEFEEDLTEKEQEILASMMLSRWILPKVNHSDLLELHLSPKDFQSYSPANQLKELRELKKDIKKDSEDLITKYTYSGDLSELS